MFQHKRKRALDAMNLYLLSRKLHQKGLNLLPRFIQRLNRFINLVDLRYTADIDPSVTLLHNGLGCVIHGRVVIGAGTTICQNVTIGGNGKPGESLNLVIGRNAFIGAGACILSGGEMYIGDNTRVGANAVVLSSVPKDCTAVGVPARIIHKGDKVIRGKEQEVDKS